MEAESSAMQLGTVPFAPKNIRIVRLNAGHTHKSRLMTRPQHGGSHPLRASKKKKKKKKTTTAHTYANKPHYTYLGVYLFCPCNNRRSHAVRASNKSTHALVGCSVFYDLANIPVISSTRDLHFF